MRKSRLVAPVALLLLLTGCSASGPDPEKVAAYHTVVHAMPAFADTPTATLDKAGKAVCKLIDLDAKHGWAQAVQAASKTDDDVLQANLLVVAAVSAFCPQHNNDIPAEYRAH